MHSVIRLESDELFDMVIKTALAHASEATGVLPDVWWGKSGDDAFVWVHVFFGESERTIEEALKGRLHITSLWYAQANPQFQREINYKYHSRNFVVELSVPKAPEMLGIPGLLAEVEAAFKLQDDCVEAPVPDQRVE